MHKDEIQEIGRRLREAREACGLGRLEVAESLGFVRSTLLRWERGDRLPKEKDLLTLLKVYQISSEWLFEKGKVEMPLRSQAKKEVARQVLDELGGPHATEETNSNQIINRDRFKSHSRHEAIRMAHSRISQGEPVTKLDQCLYLEEIAGRIKVVLADRPEIHSLTGVSSEVLVAMKNGLVIPTTVTLLLLADATGVKPEWYLTGQETKA